MDSGGASDGGYDLIACLSFLTPHFLGVSLWWCGVLCRLGFWSEPAPDSKTVAGPAPTVCVACGRRGGQAGCVGRSPRLWVLRRGWGIYSTNIRYITMSVGESVVVGEYGVREVLVFLLKSLGGRVYRAKKLMKLVFLAQ